MIVVKVAWLASNHGAHSIKRSIRAPGVTIVNFSIEAQIALTDSNTNVLRVRVTDRTAALASRS